MFWKKKQQKKETEWQARIEVFSRELKELCEKHGVDIRGKITAYGPMLEIFDVGERESAKTDNK